VQESELRVAVAEGLSIRELAERFGFASGGPLRYWLNKYELRTVRSANPRMNWKFSEAQLVEAVSASTSVSGVLRFLGVRQPGGSHTHLSRRIKELNIDTSHFRRMPIEYVSDHKRMACDILIVLPVGATRTPRKFLHRALQEIGVLYKCVSCDNPGEWLGGPLMLEIDHFDGDWHNNLRENLRYLCPNCHGQTPTHRNKKRTSVDNSVRPE
jgi:5-methylcytosine-specific restriction endonuclease McrA